MSQAKTFFSAVLIAVILSLAPKAEAGWCEEVTKLKSQVSAHEAADRVRQYVAGARGNFDSPADARKSLDVAYALANTCGANIDFLVAQKDALMKSAWYAAARYVFQDLKDFVGGKLPGPAQWYIAHAYYALIDAEAQGVNVAVFTNEFTILCSGARKTEAVQLLATLEDPVKNPAMYGYESMQDAIEAVRDLIADARRGGVDVSDVESRLMGFESQALIGAKNKSKVN